MGFLPKGFEWIVILVVVLIIFGPKNLPKLGKSLGATVKNLREGMQGDDDTATSEDAPAGESEDDARIRELEEQLAAAKKQKEEHEAE